MTKSIGIILIFCALLSGCTTPETTLADKHGHVTTCGGDSTAGWLGGVAGYYIQKSNDDKCVSDHKEVGFTVIKHAGD